MQWTSRRERLEDLANKENEAFAKAEGLADDSGPSQKENVARDWLAFSAKLLREESMAKLDGAYTERLDFDLYCSLGRVANLLEALSVGQVPSVVADINASGGRPEMWPGAKSDIQIALHYLALVESGEITDRRKIVTVCEAYGVDRTTVYKWRNEVDPNQDLSLTGADFPERLLRAGARYHFNRPDRKASGVD